MRTSVLKQTKQPVISGITYIKNTSSSRTVQELTRREVVRWVDNHFLFPPQEVIFFVHVEPDEQGLLFGCELKIHVDSETYQGFEISAGILTAVRKCLKRMKKIGRDPLPRVFPDLEEGSQITHLAS